MSEITISMEEYKELLIIKGKYEELKSQQLPKVNTPIIRTPSLEPQYKVTFEEGKYDVK